MFWIAFKYCMIQVFIVISMESKHAYVSLAFLNAVFYEQEQYLSSLKTKAEWKR